MNQVEHQELHSPDGRSHLREKKIPSRAVLPLHRKVQVQGGDKSSRQFTAACLAQLDALEQQLPCLQGLEGVAPCSHLHTLLQCHGNMSNK